MFYQHNSCNCQICIVLQTLTPNSANTANTTHPHIFIKRTSIDFETSNKHNASNYIILYLLYFTLYILYYTMLYLCVVLKLDF